MPQGMFHAFQDTDQTPLFKVSIGIEEGRILFLGIGDAAMHAGEEALPHGPPIEGLPCCGRKKTAGRRSSALSIPGC